MLYLLRFFTIAFKSELLTLCPIIIEFVKYFSISGHTSAKFGQSFVFELVIL